MGGDEPAAPGRARQHPADLVVLWADHYAAVAPVSPGAGLHPAPAQRNSGRHAAKGGETSPTRP
jgi:hypothetical protein